jgi:hypothetical protein
MQSFGWEILGEDTAYWGDRRTLALNINSIQVVLYRDQWQGLLTTVMNFLVA